MCPAAPEVALGGERRPVETMLGKDYMLAIILVNCDGVHRGSGWEDQKPRGDEG